MNRLTNEIGVKLKGVLELDSKTALLAQLQLISKQLVGVTFANASQVQTLRCGFFGEGMQMKTMYQRG